MEVGSPVSTKTSRAAQPPRFTAETLAFLRALRRHNDREWFRARRDSYEEKVRTPMVAVIERLSDDFARFAPELVASPRVSLFRIYRDTRFSPDKRPLKTHVGAVFPWRGLPRHSGAGGYFELAPEHVLVAGGLYMPEPAHIYALREHIAAHFDRLRRIEAARAFRAAFGRIEGDALQRVPRGFPRDHPAAEYLKLRQYVVSREYPPAFATTPRFYTELLRLFRLMMPLIRFLNEPLVELAARHPDLAAGTPSSGSRTTSLQEMS